MTTYRINKLRILFLLVAGLVSGAGLNAQGWVSLVGLGWPGDWPGALNNDGNYTTGVYQLGDGIYGGVANLATSNGDYLFSRVDADGSQQHYDNTGFNSELHTFNHYSRSSLLLENDALLILEEKSPVTNDNSRSLYLSHYVPTDVVIPYNKYQLDWHQLIFSQNFIKTRGHSLIHAPGGGFAVLGSTRLSPTNSNYDVLLVKTDASGTVSWVKVYETPDHDFGAQMTAATDGGYYILKTLRPEADTFRREAHLMKVDANGEQQWNVNFTGAGNDLALDMTATLDGGLAITGVNKASGFDAFILKTDASGNILWRRDYLMPGRGVEGRRIVEDPNGDLVIAANLIDSATMKRDIYLFKSDASGLPLWERNIGLKTYADIALALINTADGGYLVGGSADPGTWPLALMIKTDVNGIIKAGRITGNVMRDLDADCSVTPADTPLENWVVQAFRDSTKVFYGTTDNLGNYAIPCDTGSYVVKVIPPSVYWNVCVQDVAIHVGYLDTIQTDFSVDANTDCPYMTIEHGNTIVRPCDTTTFIVRYCNNGPSTAANASFQIELDEVFTFLYGDVPPSAQDGNVLTFPLGDIPSGECGEFRLSTFVDCSAPMGHVACSEVHIFPDSLCTPPDPAWSGALIRVENTCDGDSVHFILKNTGAQDMPAALEYIIIEDAVLLMQGDFQLDAQEERDIALPANGSTYHLIAEQEPFAPGSPLQLAFVEGCNTDPSGETSTGFANQFQDNDADPFISSNCTIVFTSFDPNDKQAIPTGFGPEHNIFANTELEYTIRFQNTGNDTAFRVVLLDTLSRFLDPASIQPGASSHPYEYTVEGNGTLRFIFQNILLPDSTTNPDGSQGFVNFRIRQQPGNPVGTVIENNADIYFDFNKPVRTNTVFHTIHEPLFDVISTTTVDPEIKMDVETYPNPFSEQLRIKLSGTTIPNTTFQLFNMTGQLVRTLQLTENQALLQREGLDAGLYFFTVKSGQRLLGTGKVVVK